MLLTIETNHDITPQNATWYCITNRERSYLREIAWTLAYRNPNQNIKSDVKDFIRDTNKSIQRLRDNLDLSRFIDDLESELENLSDNLNLDNV